MSAHNQIIEHIVLLKFKPDVDSTKLEAIMDELKGLASLFLATDIIAGKLIRSTSTSTPVTFSHIHRCRFGSLDDLQVYNNHPEHLRVGAIVHPLIEDIVVADWISNGIAGLQNPGSVMRVRLFKLKEDSVEHEKSKLVIEGIKNRFKSTEEVSFGENFCHVDWAKGYSIALMAIFPDLGALDSYADADLVNLNTAKVKDLIENELVADYVFP